MQALASERELLVSLFGADDGIPSAVADAPDQARSGSGRLTDVTSPRAAAGSEAPKTSALLDQVFESICRPLKVGRSTRSMVMECSNRNVQTLLSFCFTRMGTYLPN